MKFPYFKQLDSFDCGPACLRMISAFHGKQYSSFFLREKTSITRQGVNLINLSEAAEDIGFKTLSISPDITQLKETVPLPCILHWNQNHYVVLFDVKNDKFHIADPDSGITKIKEKEFIESWQGNANKGIALLLEPNSDFLLTAIEKKNKSSLKYLYLYLAPYRKHLLLVALSMLLGSLLSLVLPFLMQGIVDYGINNKDISFVYLMLASQLILFVGTASIEITRSWLMLHINSRINITIVSAFISKLMRMPIRYFDAKQVGDIRQRISDNYRIQGFLTGASLQTFFSFFNLVIYVVVLTIYSITILSIYTIFSLLSIIWIWMFLNKRKELDYERFRQASENEGIVYEIILGMQEIKLNNSELAKKNAWQKIQARQFKLSMKNLALGQYQSSGAQFINQLKNLVISGVSALLVIKGEITLGMMMSISYIIGQLNSPVQHISSFIQSAQDAKISLDRLGEIQQIDEEEKLDIDETRLHKESKFNDGIKIKNASFRYEKGKFSPLILEDVNLHIPHGKVTAIVGTSGSGKTTLVKLLLRFYDLERGTIETNGYNIENISPSYWRSLCGSVMQDGYIFNDTIENNIVANGLKINIQQLETAIKIANIGEYIDSLPLGLNTKIGNAGLGLSSGQRQRILLARAIYKDPDYLFLDEATSVLDANNEKVIIENLNTFFRGRTVVVVAHRLSTVRNADKIVVLDMGRVVEEGNHDSLIKLRSNYYNLVKNQLELGK